MPFFFVKTLYLLWVSTKGEMNTMQILFWLCRIVILKVVNWYAMHKVKVRYAILSLSLATPSLSPSFSNLLQKNTNPMSWSLHSCSYFLAVWTGC